MPKYLLIVDYQPGVDEAGGFDKWSPDEIKAHMDYYGALREELLASGELVTQEALTGPELARTVTSDGTATVVTDGPFAEFKEMLAGYQVVDVDSEERAIEIAAKISAVPGPGGVPLQQPIGVRRVMGPADFEQLM